MRYLICLVWYLMSPYFLKAESKFYSSLTLLDGSYFIGGKNTLEKYDMKDGKLVSVSTFKQFVKIRPTQVGYSNGILINMTHSFYDASYTRTNRLYPLDHCMSYLQESTSQIFRKESPLDWTHYTFHTPNANHKDLVEFCTNTFIKAILPYSDTKYWVCGTSGSFPKAFLVNKSDLSFLEFVDENFASCSRYIDEPMAAHVAKNDEIYIGSGWGLYKPYRPNPKSLQSMMMYANWRTFRDGVTISGLFSYVLSSDVNFIKVVKETNDHLYFFGYEINNQYTLTNQDDRNSWQSFMIRVCKSDPGFFSPIPNEDYTNTILPQIRQTSYAMMDKVDNKYFAPKIHYYIDYKEVFYQTNTHLPRRLFTTPVKVNFGCYVSRRPFSFSDNYFWGETNIVYINRMADVIYDPNKQHNIYIKNNNPEFGCNENQPHKLSPMVGIFNREGLRDTSTAPVGAICHLLINQNAFPDIGAKYPPFENYPSSFATNAYEETLYLNGMLNQDFLGVNYRRINGFSCPSHWNQGVDYCINESYYNLDWIRNNLGRCHNNTNLTDDQFKMLMNYSNYAWPNSLPNKLYSPTQHTCQFPPAELFTFNATFVLPNVEFKKMFVLKDNITDYVMHNISNEIDVDKRRHYSPLMIFAVISTDGELFRIVTCDLHNAMLNQGVNKTKYSWKDWCIFRHTDQPYVYRQYLPLESREYGISLQFRASHLLKTTHLLPNLKQNMNYPPNSPLVKDIVSTNEPQERVVIITKETHSVHSIVVDCKEYSTCVECASDPVCMWNINSAGCSIYDNTYTRDGHIQDVLDSGYKCREQIKNVSKNVIQINRDTDKVFFCSTHKFWREEIKWKVNNDSNFSKCEAFKPNRVNPLLNEPSQPLYLACKSLNGINTISCIGINTDLDKLYNGNEYKWINSIINNGPIVLNDWIVVDSSTSSKPSSGFISTTVSSSTIASSSTNKPSFSNATSTTPSYCIQDLCVMSIILTVLLIISLIANLGLTIYIIKHKFNMNRHPNSLNRHPNSLNNDKEEKEMIMKDTCLNADQLNQTPIHKQAF